MSDWVHCTVRDVITHIASGPSPTCEERNAAASEWGLLKTTAATWGGWNERAHKVPPLEYWGQERLEVHSDDVVITKAGPRNRVGVVVHVPRTRPRLMVSGKMVLLRPDKSQIVPRLLADVLASRPSQKYLDDRTTGMAEAQTNFANSALLSTPLHLPPVKEQRRIAEVLDTIDEIIQATERAIDKLELVRLGLRERFCAPDGSSPGPSLLSAMVESVVDCPHSTPEYLDSGVLVARTMHIKNGRFLTESASRVSEASYRERIARKVPAPGDVVLTREAPVGEAFAIPEGMRICLGQRVVLIRPGPELLGQYLVELIYSTQGQRQIRRMSAGTTNPHLNVDDIRDLAFDVPRPEAQHSALRSLAAATSEIDAEQAKLLKLKQMRSGLAADLLSGRVRTVGA